MHLDQPYLISMLTDLDLIEIGMISWFPVSLICVCVIECSAQASDRGQCQGHFRSHCQYEWGLWIILYWPENNGATFQCPPNYTKNFKFTHENRIQFLDLSSLYARVILNEHYFSSTPRHKYSLSVKSLHIWSFDFNGQSASLTLCKWVNDARKSCVNIKGNHQSWLSRPRYATLFRDYEHLPGHRAAWI